MAGEIRKKSPDANILAWNWTDLADSLAPDSKSDILACLAVAGASPACGIVPVSMVDFQAVYLARAFESIYLEFDGEAGDVQFLGHSLGAGIAANAAKLLGSASSGPAEDIERLTLFDAPENIAAISIGGKVNLDTVLPRIIRNTPDITIENYSAAGLTAADSLLGYGISYEDVANTRLLGYVHTKELLGPTPMDWYKPTVNPAGGGSKSERGLSESNEDLHARDDQVWANLDTDDDWNLSLLVRDISRVSAVMMDTWHDLKDWGTKVIVDTAKYIADATTTLMSKIGTEIAGLAAGVKVELSELTDWASTGFARFVVGKGLELVSSSPSYAYRTLHIPDSADSLYIEFLPEVWGVDDSYVVFFDDEVIYRLDGTFFKNGWMDTGFLDISRWAGRDVLFTIGLLSGETGHQITTGGFGFTSRVLARSHSVPAPGTLFLLGMGLVGIAAMRRRRA
ncbi:PEP-CTERM sorting domain-containing protein [Immundisolibacter sp.]|uniref:PEP-CTERM sorting domain-containing protein n=1 Tax=Immundisolibacter sp. TaxID=1934948 RepID=UPI0035629B5C